MRHILVKTKAEADRIHSQLESGGTSPLRRASTRAPATRALTVSRGQTVALFDKAAFTLETNQLSQPVKTEFGYHLIQPLAAVKAGSVTPFADVKAQIRTQLLEERKSAAVNDWAADIQKEYEGKVTYAAGFEPPDTSTTGEETGITAGGRQRPRGQRPRGRERGGAARRASSCRPGACAPNALGPRANGSQRAPHRRRGVLRSPTPPSPTTRRSSTTSSATCSSRSTSSRSCSRSRETAISTARRPLGARQARPPPPACLREAEAAPRAACVSAGRRPRPRRRSHRSSTTCPAALALLLARKVQRRAAAVGYDWVDLEGPLEKLGEELEELLAEVARIGRLAAETEPDARVEASSATFFTVVNVARFVNVDPSSPFERRRVGRARASSLPSGSRQRRGRPGPSSTWTGRNAGTSGRRPSSAPPKTARRALPMSV